jgi:hypothetical protein
VTLKDSASLGAQKPLMVSNSLAVIIMMPNSIESGTRVIPEGTLTGVQFIQTPDYVQGKQSVISESITNAIQ